MADGRKSGQGTPSPSTTIADCDATSVNEARALRVTEVLRDYQNIQRRIAHIQANPDQDEYHEVGYTTIRQCHADARTLLNLAYPPEMLHPPSGPNEAEKRQLQRYV